MDAAMSAMGKCKECTMPIFHPPYPAIARCLRTDKDGNGTVDFDEFYTWYRGSSRAMGKAEVKVLAYLKRSRDA